MPDCLLADAVSAGSPYTLVAFGAYMAGVFLLGFMAHFLLKRGDFLKEYFLGDRKLGPWVLALTYVATSVSAGSLLGFPSFIYTCGWVMALWIGGYMISGLVTKGVLAKRLNQVSRLTGAITVPDVLRDRFRSPMLGLSAGVLLVLFLICNLVAQFKAGGLILRRACEGVEERSEYRAARDGTARALTAAGVWSEEQAAREKKGNLYDGRYPDYVLGILIFAVTVIAYTTYGGFWAVTWTDVLQGLVIVAGSLLLMVFALRKVGGLENATARLRAIDPALLAGPGPGNFVPIRILNHSGEGMQERPNPGKVELSRSFLNPSLSIARFRLCSQTPPKFSELLTLLEPSIKLRPFPRLISDFKTNS